MSKRIVYTMDDFRSPPKDRKGWYRVCRDRILSEKFIEDHADEVYWLNKPTAKKQYTRFASVNYPSPKGNGLVTIQ